MSAPNLLRKSNGGERHYFDLETDVSKVEIKSAKAIWAKLSKDDPSKLPTISSDSSTDDINEVNRYCAAASKLEIRLLNWIIW